MKYFQVVRQMHIPFDAALGGILFSVFLASEAGHARRAVNKDEAVVLVGEGHSLDVFGELENAFVRPFVVWSSLLPVRSRGAFLFGGIEVSWGWLGYVSWS
jgi:hypothetical protein